MYSQMSEGPRMHTVRTTAKKGEGGGIVNVATKFGVGGIRAPYFSSTTLPTNSLKVFLVGHCEGLDHKNMLSLLLTTSCTLKSDLKYHISVSLTHKYLGSRPSSINYRYELCSSQDIVYQEGSKLTSKTIVQQSVKSQDQ